MFIKSLAVASVLALSTFANSAHATALSWTVTMQGIINNGSDTSGVFGTAGQDLSGLSFTQSITAITDTYQWRSRDGGGTYTNMYYQGPAFSDTVTVNGKSVTFNIEINTSGSQSIADSLSKGVPGDRDYINNTESGDTGNGASLFAYNYVLSYASSFVPSIDFGQTLSQDISAASFTKGSYFSISGNQSASFSGTPDFLALNASTVPEPATFMLLGLGALGLLSHRRTFGKS